jgi:hypothetical protein
LVFPAVNIKAAQVHEIPVIRYRSVLEYSHMGETAGCVAERAVNAGRDVGSLVGVAVRAVNSCHFGGVRIVLDGSVAIGAGQNTVGAGRVFRGINRDALAAA